MTNPFAGVTSPIDGGDIVTAGTSLVVALAPIVLVVMALVFAPKLIGVIKSSIGKSKN